MAQPTKYIDRSIPQISLHDFPSRIDTITAELCSAAERVGFFALTNHCISPEDISSMFALSQQFFALPDPIKATVPWNPNNAGYECRSQVRPSTGAPDCKESYQLQFGENMFTKPSAAAASQEQQESKERSDDSKSLWMSDSHLPGFKDQSLSFMHKLQRVSEQLMLCFARGLGFPDDYFVKFHDVTRPNCQSVMRLLHYFATPKPSSFSSSPELHHRAGAHADWGFLTLLLQGAPGYTGLEICPGREAVTSFALDDTWTKVAFPTSDAIICNIGDLLMNWSDDRFKSTFHRVKAPVGEEGDFYDERYSIAFFNQPCKDAVIQGPGKKYPVVTGEEFIRRAMGLHFKALQEKLRSQRQAEEAATRRIGLNGQRDEGIVQATA